MKYSTKLSSNCVLKEVAFKILAKHFFSEFSKVITDFEITKLPKKTDVLIIETEKPITDVEDTITKKDSH